MGYIENIIEADLGSFISDDSAMPHETSPSSLVVDGLMESGRGLTYQLGTREGITESLRLLVLTAAAYSALC